MEKTINWGIIGLGHIAHKFAADLLLINHLSLKAVASRDLAKAKSFAEKYHADKYYSSYQDLVKDPAIDVVYIATPHAFHYENTMMCLNAGKSVLCEKAFGMNAREVKGMMDHAKKQNRFLMEALWTRFIPATEKLLELIHKNTIGEIKQIKADFGFVGDKNPERRIYNKKLGGGSLLDVGIYPVYLSLLLLDTPQKMNAEAVMTSSEVDAQCNVHFQYKNGAASFIESSIVKASPVEAFIYGTKGSIKMHRSFHHCEKLTIKVEDQETELIDLKHIGNGYYHEILEVNSCLERGKLESDKMPHAMSLKLINTLDAIREKIKLHY